MLVSILSTSSLIPHGGPLQGVSFFVQSFYTVLFIYASPRWLLFFCLTNIERLHRPTSWPSPDFISLFPPQGVFDSLKSHLDSFQPVLLTAGPLSSTIFPHFRVGLTCGRTKIFQVNLKAEMTTYLLILYSSSFWKIF